jgi:hypothetical protein
MRSAGAQITTSESVLFEIMKDATHPDFKAVSSIVKEYSTMTNEALNVLVNKL